MEHWTQERYDAFRRELYARQEEAYRQFHTKLLRSDLPVIGLRAPLLRKIAGRNRQGGRRGISAYLWQRNL